MNKTCIVIAGPTAVGKTALAVDIARHFSTAIISADSRQCYRELNIGVAKPSAAELAQVHHYFVDSHSVHDNVSAADFEKYALEAAARIFEHSDVAVMTGGTGLYIRAFCEGMDPIPPVEEAIRKQVTEAYALHGIQWLQEEIRTADPDFFEKGEMQNPQRMMRALEVKRSSGQSILSYQTNAKVKRDFNIIRVALELPREGLYERINRRVDEMMAAGLANEVKSLLPYQSLNALQTVGYRELFAYHEGEISLSRAVELIKQHTRHYAKRQMTWFKKDPAFSWYAPQYDVLLKGILAEMDQQALRV